MAIPPTLTLTITLDLTLTSPKAYHHTASSVRIDDLVKRDACLLKADVEGYEPQVLQTAQLLLHARTVPPP